MLPTLPVLDDVRASAKLAALAAALFLGGAILIPVLVLNAVWYWAAWLLCTILVVVGGGLLLQLLPRYRRRNTPYLVITQAGFRCPGLADPIVPWSSIDHARVSDNPIVCTDFVFKPDAPLPVRDRTRANVQLSPRRRLLSIRGPSPRGMGLEAYAAAIAAGIASAAEGAQP